MQKVASCVCRLDACVVRRLDETGRRKREKEGAERQMQEPTNARASERNILNITARPRRYSICDYEEQTSLCDLFSPFSFPPYVFSVLPFVFLTVFFSPCACGFSSGSEKKKRTRRRRRRKRRHVMRCGASIQYGENERRTIFLRLNEREKEEKRSRAKKRGWRETSERERERKSTRRVH